MKPLLSAVAAVAIVLGAAPPASATFSGREGRIAGIQPGAPPTESRLVTSNVDGSDVREIARGAQSPRWSANGDVLAWISQSEVFVADGDGSNPRRVTQGAVGNIAISPDGRTLVVAKILPRNRRNWIREDLVLVDVATGRERLLAYEARDPTYSPDGERVGFVDLRRQNPRRYRDIGVVRTNRRGRRLVYRSDRYTNTGIPDWSPAGGTIVFNCSRFANGRLLSDLCLVGVGSGRVRVLARGVDGGTWSPTDRRILATEHQTTTSPPEVVTVPARGGRPTRLGWQGFPLAWQPLARR